MSDRSAGVHSTEALGDFRAALWKFAESATAALGDADAEIDRTMLWLETEQAAYWSGQIHRRHELVMRAKEALRAKKMFRTELARPSVVEEQKALEVAERRLEEANGKLVAVRKYSVMLKKQMLIYRGMVQRFAGDVQVEIPKAVAHLDRLMAELERYLMLQPEGASTEVPSAGSGGVDAPASMARPEPGEPEEPAARKEDATGPEGATPPKGGTDGSL